MHSTSIAEREAEVMTDEAKATIDKFDKELSSNIQSESKTAQGQGFCGGLCFALGIIVVSVPVACQIPL